MQNTFDNRDFYLSAYLMAVGYKLISRRKAHNITTFIFEDSEEFWRELVVILGQPIWLPQLFN